MNNKKYQVFISSTYADLVEAWKKINDLRATKEEISSLTEQTDIAFENQAIKTKFLSGSYGKYFNDNKKLYWGLRKKGRIVRDDLILIKNS